MIPGIAESELLKLAGHFKAVTGQNCLKDWNSGKNYKRQKVQATWFMQAECRSKEAMGSGLCLIIS